MSPDPRTKRMERVGERLADALDDSLTTLAALRSAQQDHQPLTEEEAATALATLLQQHGIQLNDGLLHALTRTTRGRRRRAEAPADGSTA